MAQQRERYAPRISVNKLGEYLVATPRRRRRIISDQRTPPDCKVAWYAEARKAMARYVAGGLVDDAVLDAAISSLAAERGKGSAWDRANVERSVEALELFGDLGGDLELQGMEPELGMVAAPPLRVCGVVISVRPEVVLRGVDGAGRPTLGAVKLYLVKGRPLGPIAGGYVATVLSRYLAANGEGERVDRRRCFVVDVFAGDIYTAPGAFKSRMADVEAACEEIARGWNA